MATATAKLSADLATIVREQVARIHAAVNDGTLDRDVVNDALAKLSELAGDKPDSFTEFTGQKGDKAVDAKHASK